MLVTLFIILMEKILRKQDWQTLHCCVREARPLWLCVGVPGTGIISASVPEKLLLMATINDFYISAREANTLGNFTKATFDAVSKTYSSLIP
ncbi:hypothetical protein U0070_008605 [Myodes glareolus]|uniref:Small ribosomal subunit protein uS5 C-terminal domain-containing protein n=1 Tax=Myodes glareolus TaxID=447135 RepID=A0AAW0JG74_MYOGA